MTARLLRGLSAESYRSEEYAEDKAPRLSASIATILVNQSPLHAMTAHPRLGGVSHEATAAMDSGSLLHAILLGKGEIAVIDAPDWRTNRAKELRDAARAAGQTPVLAEKHQAAMDAAIQIRLRLDDLGVKFDGESEVGIEWTEEMFDRTVICRGMFDHLRESAGEVIDLKTTESAEPMGWARKAVGYGADIQAAAYVRALEQLHPEMAGRVTFQWILVEPEPPYAVVVAQPAGDMRELGKRRWERAVNAWGACLAENMWPGYSAHAYISPPGWALSAEGVEPE